MLTRRRRGPSLVIYHERTALRQENQELKAENSTLRDKVTNLSLITSNLNNKVKENENERLSVVTVIKLIQTDLRPRGFQHDWQQQTKTEAEHTHMGQTKITHTQRHIAAKQPVNDDFESITSS